MDDPEVLKQELMELIKQRDDLEEESKILRDFVSMEGDQASRLFHILAFIVAFLISSPCFVTVDP
eukprot:9581-Eustigmatos_ZCMA.PRE.1